MKFFGSKDDTPDETVELEEDVGHADFSETDDELFATRRDVRRGTSAARLAVPVVLLLVVSGGAYFFFAQGASSSHQPAPAPFVQDVEGELAFEDAGAAEAFGDDAFGGMGAFADGGAMPPQPMVVETAPMEMGEDVIGMAFPPMPEEPAAAGGMDGFSPGIQMLPEPPPVMMPEFAAGPDPFAASAPMPAFPPAPMPEAAGTLSDLPVPEVVSPPQQPPVQATAPASPPAAQRAAPALPPPSATTGSVGAPLPPAPPPPQQQQQHAAMPHVSELAQFVSDMTAVRPLPSGYLTVRKERNPEDFDARLKVARSLLAQEKYASALELFNTMLAENPRDSRLLMGRALSLQNLRQPVAAIEAYEAVLAESPKNLEALINLLGLLKQQSPEMVIEKLLQLRSVYPYDPDIIGQLAVSYGAMKAYPEALMYIEMAESLQPDNLMFTYNKAVLFDKMGQTARAAELYRQLIRLASERQLSHVLPVEAMRQRLARMR